MGGALLYASAAAAAVFGGNALITTSLVSPFGPVVVDRAKNMRRHTWPVHATNRKSLLDQVFAGDGGTGAALRRILEEAADYTLDEITENGHRHAATTGQDVNDVVGVVPECAEPYVAEMECRQPGLWAELAARGCYVRRTEGTCLNRVIGTHCAMILDPSAPVRCGDPVMVAVRGLPVVWGKIFVGVSGEQAFFWLSRPEAFLQVALADVIHMDRAILIQPLNGEPFAPESVSFPTMKVEDWTPPKLTNLSDAHDAALMSIWQELRKLAT